MRPYYLIAFCVLCVSKIHAQVSSFPGQTFARADSIAASYQNHALSDLEGLSRNLTENLATDVEKFRSIYRWVCNNITYDYETYWKNQTERQKERSAEEREAWNKKMRSIVFKNLIEHKKSVCTGYAYLIKTLANHAGLECHIIDGYGRSPVANVRGIATANHQWNAVRLNNHWYLADATWSSGAFNLTDHAFIRRYDDNYFLADPSMFVRNHYPLDTTWLLIDMKPTLKEFVSRPLIYSAAYHYGIKDILPDSFDITAIRNTSVTIRFRTSDKVKPENLKLHIENNSKEESVSVSPVRDQEGFYNVQHTFRSRGKRVMHMVLDDAPVFSFSIEVR
jgi:hypothetical protein